MHLWTIAAVGVALMTACGEDSITPPPPALGALEVTVSGLPSGTAALVTVTGPSGGTPRTVTATSTIPDLTPGAYDIAAQNVLGSGVSYVPSPATQRVTVAASATARAAVSYAASVLQLQAQVVAQGLSGPVYLTAPRGDARLFIVEQPGRIRIVKDGNLLPTPFLDMTSRVVSGGERGLLSLAFDPGYATNGRFYVYYTGAQGDIFVDRHTVSSNPDVANTAFDPVITIQHRSFANHNGGLLLFGPDGMLYIGTGDGGGGGDPQNNGQNINSLLGKLLRINVATLPYTSPAGNPYLGVAGADEIWATGLRNPWRFAFDTPPGSAATLYIADVGQGAWEEVNAVLASEAGRNYGWRTMEGSRCYNPSSGCVTTGLTLPVLEYDHGATGGCSVTGGFVYRGAAIPEIVGHYFYADYCRGWVRSFRLQGGTAVDLKDWGLTGLGNINSFGVDGAGELYVLSASGRVLRLARQ